MLLFLFHHTFMYIIASAEGMDAIFAYYMGLVEPRTQKLVESYINDLIEHNNLCDEFKVSKPVKDTITKEFCRRFELFLMDVLKHDVTGKLLNQLQTILNSCSEEFLR